MTAWRNINMIIMMKHSTTGARVPGLLLSRVARQCWNSRTGKYELVMIMYVGVVSYPSLERICRVPGNARHVRTVKYELVMMIYLERRVQFHWEIESRYFVVEAWVRWLWLWLNMNMIMRKSLGIGARVPGSCFAEMPDTVLEFQDSKIWIGYDDMYGKACSIPLRDREKVLCCCGMSKMVMIMTEYEKDHEEKLNHWR